jgi:hypothetical protein
MEISTVLSDYRGGGQKKEEKNGYDLVKMG